MISTSRFYFLLARISCLIDSGTERIGNTVSWFSLAMVLVTLTIVFLGLFNYGRIWLQDIVTYMHGILFMAAVGYTLKCEAHVRIDVFYGKFSARKKAVVDLFGTLLLLLPTLLVISFNSWPYVLRSWQVWEGAFDAGGLPGIFLLKTFILLFCFFTAMQGLSLAMKSLLILCGKSSADRDKVGD